MANLLFVFFALFTVICAVGVVANKNAVNAAMCLLLCLAGIAGLFVQLDAFLLAFILILVYAGAIVALFLFIIMLLDSRGDEPFRTSRVALAASGCGLAVLLVGLLSLVRHGQFPVDAPPAAGAQGADLKLYAYQLFTTYLLPVQVMGFLLLIAMLGVIVLAKRHHGVEDIR